MKKVFLLCTVMSFIGSRTLAQGLNFEVMAGNKNSAYQHILFQKFNPTSKFIFFNISSLYAFYNNDRADEIMSQSYIAYSLAPWVNVAVGSFYASGPGFSPSINVQLIKRTEKFFLLVVPRTEIKSDASYELMTMLEYRAKLSEKIKFYSRVQLMSHYGPDFHNRSYQALRSGIDIKNVQYGLAMNIDEYGSATKTFYNVGAFIRKEL